MLIYTFIMVPQCHKLSTFAAAIIIIIIIVFEIYKKMYTYLNQKVVFGIIMEG